MATGKANKKEERLEDYSQKTLLSRIEAYFQQIQEEQREPTVPGLCAALNITKRDLTETLARAEALRAAQAPQQGEKGLPRGKRTASHQEKGVLGRSGEEQEKKKEAALLAAADQVERALQRIQDRLEQRRDSMALFLLKQPVYGGYLDRPASSRTGGPVQVEVLLEMPEETEPES